MAEVSHGTGKAATRAGLMKQLLNRACQKTDTEKVEDEINYAAQSEGSAEAAIEKEFAYHDGDASRAGSTF